MNAVNATAPYTAISFPPGGRPVLASDLWDESDLVDGRLTPAALARHDELVAGRLHGYIDVDITALTGLFIGIDSDNPAPFRFPDGRYAIPDSELQGLLRSTVRMITGGRLPAGMSMPYIYFRQPVTSGGQHTPAGRNTKQIQEDYIDRGGDVGGNRRHGWIRLAEDGDGYVIDPVPMPTKAAIAVVTGGVPTLTTTVPTNQPNWTPRQMLGDTVHHVYHLHDGQRTWALIPYTGTPPTSGDKTVLRTQAMPHLAAAIVATTTAITDTTAAIATTTAAIATIPPPHNLETRKRSLGQLKTRLSQLTRRLLILQRHHTTGAKELTLGEGVIHLTGAAAGQRKNAYIFAVPGAGAPIPVKEGMVTAFQRAEQLTDYQLEEFPSGRLPDQPAVTGSFDRAQRQPIFYTVDADDDTIVVGFGRSGGFRVSARDDTIRRAFPDQLLHHSYAQPLPKDPRRAKKLLKAYEPDVVQALFGDIDVPALTRGLDTGPHAEQAWELWDGTGQPRPAAFGAITRRISCSTAVAADAALGNEVSVVLLSPHRSCFLHYLTPRNGAVVTWADSAATLRGYKLFLHRTVEVIPSANDNEAVSRSIRPVQSGATFRGRITFTNLTRAELGVVLFALRLGNNPGGSHVGTEPTHAHKIGLGKPLGYGSIHIAYQGHLVDPSQRYTSAARHAADSVIDSAAEDELIGAAIQRLHSAARDCGHDLDELPQIRDLLLASRWAQRLHNSQTAPMPLNSVGGLPSFANKQVLPEIRVRVI